MKPRLLLVTIATSAHRMGGMEKHLDLVVEALQELDCEVTVLSTALPAGQSWDKAPLFCTDSPTAYFGRSWYASARSLFKELHQKRPFQGVISEGKAAAPLGDLPNRPPLSVFLHGFAPEHLLNQWYEVRSPKDLLRYGLLQAPETLYHALIEKRLLSQSQHSWTVAEHIRRRLIRYFDLPERKIQTILNWLSPGETPLPENVRQQERKRLNIQDHETVFVFNAVMSRQKGALMTARAFLRHMGKAQGTHLVMIGDGQERETIEQEVRKAPGGKRIHLLGKRPFQDIPSLLSLGDFFVFPTWRIEGMPYNVLEAAQQGLPFIGTQRGGVGELLQEDGLFVPLGDTEALSRAFTRARGDKAGLQEGARRVQERMKTHYTKDAAKAAMKQWIHSLP